MTKTSLIQKLTKSDPWYQNEQLIPLASSLTLCRNIEKFEFPSKLDSSKAVGLNMLLQKEFKGVKSLKKPVSMQGDKISSQEKEFLSEHFLVDSDFHHAHAAEGFVVDESGQFAASINLDDHIRLYWITSQMGLEQGYNQLVNIEGAIGANLPFAFSSRFGFLTGSTDLCGCALEAKVYVQLPALVHTEKLEEVLESTLDEGLFVSGLHGNPTEVIGDVLVVKNYYNLGVSEDEIISSVQTAAAKLIAEEQAVRLRLKEEEHAEVKDRVSRAFGILIHSYQIEAIEALNALSLIKLGCNLGWVKGVSIETLNALFFLSRRAHLQKAIGKKELSNEELLHKRAEFIHKELQGIELTISDSS